MEGTNVSLTLLVSTDQGWLEKAMLRTSTELNRKDIHRDTIVKVLNTELADSVAWHAHLMSVGNEYPIQNLVGRLLDIANEHEIVGESSSDSTRIQLGYSPREA